MGLYSILAICILVAVLVWFVLVAYRDAARLVRRKPGGAGIFRAWAVARVTVLEAWSQRAWTLPIIWFVICLLLSLLIRTYNPLEREQMYLTVFLRGQEFFVLFYVAVLACFSLPRERERHTVITTASKPLSRLEFFLGKVIGLCAVAAGLLLIMGAVTWLTMNVVDFKVRHDAQALLSMEQRDYDKTIRRYPVSKGLALVAQNGLLQAQNYVTAKDGLRIAGLISYATKPPERALRGGSSESLVYDFPPIPATPNAEPYFLFNYQPEHFNRRGVLAPGFRGIIKLHVTLSLKYNPMKTQQGTVTLSPNGPTMWTIKDPYSYFSYQNVSTGRVFSPGPLILGVNCPTKNVYLLFRNGIHAPSAVAYLVDQSRSPGNRPYIVPAPNPVITGFTSHGKEQIVGPTGKNSEIPAEVASFEFSHVKPGSLPLGKHGNFTVDMVLSVDKQSHEQQPAAAWVRAYAVNRPLKPSVQHIFVDEKRITPVKLPGRLLDGGNLVINIHSAVPGQWLGLNKDSVRLVLPPSPFILNLFKSEVVIFLEASLLAVIGVTAGIYLGWPVALLVLLTCYILGTVFHFIQRLFHSNGLGIYNYVKASRLKHVWWFQIGSGISEVMSKLLYLLVHLVPNFTKFAPLKYIAASRDMPWSVLLVDVALAALFMLPFLAVGYLLIRRKELA